MHPSLHGRYGYAPQMTEKQTPVVRFHGGNGEMRQIPVCYRVLDVNFRREPAQSCTQDEAHSGLY